MVSPALKMSHEQKQQRAKYKRDTLLLFLASGEIWTTIFIIALLLQTSERTALRLVKKLIADKLIKVDEGIVPHSNLKLYGITDFGLAISGAPETVKSFNIGRTNPAFVQHHIECQIVRIRGERAGWTSWVPEKMLYVKNEDRLKKIPDFLMRRPAPDCRKCCGELERSPKSLKRFSDVMGMHLHQIIQGRYDLVYYFVPDVAAQMRAFERVKFVTIDGNKIKLNENHRARFKIFEIKSWQGEI